MYDAEEPYVEEVEARVIKPDISGSTTDLFQDQSFTLAFTRSFRSPYLLANMVYVVYTAIIVTINLNEQVYDIEKINHLYLSANILHLVNALLYFWVWLHEGYTAFIIFVPEILNVFEACLYITSSAFYPLMGNSYVALNTTDNSNTALCGQNTTIYAFVSDKQTVIVQNIEITASLLSLIASIGWCYTWYLTYRRIPGRGFTFDDPDVWCNISIVTGALMYVVYNCQIIHDRSLYGSYYLYVQGDWIYMVNSWIYVVCALRDAGWFFWGPTSGGWQWSIQKRAIKT